MTFCTLHNPQPERDPREQADHSSCSQNAHDKNVLVRCAQLRTICLLPLGKLGIRMPSLGLVARLGVPGGRVRKRHAVEDQSDAIPRAITSKLGGGMYIVRCAQ